MATVSFRGVSKRYGTVEAVRDLDLTCPQGEMLALLGPSGCGKSSTLKMVAGVESVSTGEIWFDDRPVSSLAPGARNIAMVFEDYALYPHLTARENVAFPLRVRGAPRAEADARVDAVMALLGLEAMAGARARDLSGGAQQRISIGRALVRDPELILFDEPLSHLDGDQKVRLRAEIKRLQRTAHLTSILVTHDQSEAIAMADRVAVMNEGVLQQVGTPDDLYERPANTFVANFIGEPPMNLLAAEIATGGQLAGTGWSCPVDPARLAGMPAGTRLVAGIRPEHVGIDPAGSDATIDYVEPRGDSDILTLRLDGPDAPRLTAEIPGPGRWKAGARAGIALDGARAHLFDAESGARIGS
ncbi:MAG: ABC transporter ATP-binding protein [Pseudomonadota bacterium]